MTLQAVLFDMDGTLVDTEPYWIAAEYALVESYGGTWTDEHAHALVGNALIDSAVYIREHGGVDLDPPTSSSGCSTTSSWRPSARSRGAPARASCSPRWPSAACRVRWSRCPTPGSPRR